MEGSLFLSLLWGEISMIFSKADHIYQIQQGTKTQTRRPTDRYKIGTLYAIQPGRGKKGIPDGKILITGKRVEYKTPSPMWYYVLEDEAQAEGGYTPEEYEKLYEKMYPSWEKRYSYLFRYFPTEVLEMLDKGKMNDAFAYLMSIESQQLRKSIDSDIKWIPDPQTCEQFGHQDKCTQPEPVECDGFSLCEFTTSQNKHKKRMGE